MPRKIRRRRDRQREALAQQLREQEVAVLMRELTARPRRGERR